MSDRWSNPDPEASLCECARRITRWREQHSADPCAVLSLAEKMLMEVIGPAISALRESRPILSEVTAGEPVALRFKHGPLEKIVASKANVGTTTPEIPSFAWATAYSRLAPAAEAAAKALGLQFHCSWLDASAGSRKVCFSWFDRMGDRHSVCINGDQSDHRIRVELLAAMRGEDPKGGS